MTDFVPSAVSISPQTSLSDGMQSTGTEEDEVETYGETMSTGGHSVFTSTSTIASKPSSVMSNLSLVSIEKDDAGCIDRSCGWIGEINFPFCDGMQTNLSYDDFETPPVDTNKSLLFSSRASPYSSRLYKKRRRGSNRHRSSKFLSRFAEKRKTANNETNTIEVDGGSGDELEEDSVMDDPKEEKEEMIPTENTEGSNQSDPVAAATTKNITISHVPNFQRRRLSVRSVVQRTQHSFRKGKNKSTTA